MNSMHIQRDDHSDAELLKMLHLAIESQNYNDIQSLIESDEYIDALNEQGLSVFSALFSHRTLFSMITDPAEIYLYDSTNQHRYIEMDDEGNYGKIVDENDGFLEIVRLILSNEINPNVTDTDGATPLHWASYYGLKGVVVALLDAGANPTARDYLNDHTPRDYADDSHRLDGDAYAYLLKEERKEERRQAVCRRLDAIDAFMVNSPLDISISGFLSLKDLTFFSSVAKPERIQHFLQNNMCSTPL